MGLGFEAQVCSASSGSVSLGRPAAVGCFPVWGYLGFQKPLNQGVAGAADQLGCPSHQVTEGLWKPRPPCATGR